MGEPWGDATSGCMSCTYESRAKVFFFDKCIALYALVLSVSNTVTSTDVVLVPVARRSRTNACTMATDALNAGYWSHAMSCWTAGLPQ
ncbi:hypothetical protein H257_07054 [Aphanomyces astaci]|uniref:Uncharacterized protein n=1 Tax=Aphanomyces astaci TaxID=112090 RepID=W4GLQ3_APHAT|nr:hypothetical protein H257_07054 [Aphanomyces astaci]ETV79838.1 hypothetical protein H257_07054 [Aphanomyces astaci]|eukprot:XP_009830774.1 hypothetical protein H257_07054 [Aphanomyces astaci]